MQAKRTPAPIPRNRLAGVKLVGDSIYTDIVIVARARLHGGGSGPAGEALVLVAIALVAFQADDISLGVNVGYRLIHSSRIISSRAA